MSAADRDDDGVGYGRPPKHSRFQPGRSGNPRGRPRKALVAVDPASEPSKAAVLRAGLRPVSVRRDGHVERMPMIDAIFESIAQKAVAGSRLHSKLLLDHMRAGEAEARASRIEEYEAFRRIVDKNQERLDAAAAAGLPPPAVYPHPRDVRFGLPSEPVELLGPTSAADAESYRPLVALRDFAISYAAYSLLYHWTGKRSADPDDPDAALPASMMLALVLDRELPPSMQRGIPDAFKALGDAAKQPEAEHRAELLREMQTLGMLPPGKHRDVPRQPKIPAKIVYREFGGTAHDRMCEFVRQRLPRRTADRLLRLLEAPAKGGARA